MTDEIRVALVSLGCVKNLVDSEKMLGLLAEAGCAITAEDDADIVVINTCGFLAAAREEADEVIREMVQRKNSGSVRRVVVVGCLAQRDKQALLDRIDGIDALVGVNNRDDVVRAVLGQRAAETSGGTDLFLGDYHPFVQIDTARLRLTPRHYAYLRISEGCDQRCTFCTIPAIRGAMHCKPPEIVLAEARELVEDGVVEINLIGQDTTSYGLGADGFGVGLAGLLRELDKVDGLRWIRLMYAYPTVLTDDIIDTIGECEHVCNYIDVPLQHINDRVLRAMGRRIDRAATEQLLTTIRERIPGVTIRTTLIAGFPGETEGEFEELRRFIEEFRFDALGVFPYSLEPDTSAGRIRDRVCGTVVAGRVDRLMTTQQKVAFDLAEQCIGSTVEVLVDEHDDDGMIVARHRGQAPLVDAVTYVADCDASAGDLLKVRCTARQDYDLVATPVQVAPPP